MYANYQHEYMQAKSQRFPLDDEGYIIRAVEGALVKNSAQVDGLARHSAIDVINHLHDAVLEASRERLEGLGRYRIILINAGELIQSCEPHVLVLRHVNALGERNIMDLRH